MYIYKKKNVWRVAIVKRGVCFVHIESHMPCNPAKMMIISMIVFFKCYIKWFKTIYVKIDVFVL